MVRPLATAIMRRDRRDRPARNPGLRLRGEELDEAGVWTTKRRRTFSASAGQPVRGDDLQARRLRTQIISLAHA